MGEISKQWLATPEGKPSQRENKNETTKTSREDAVEMKGLCKALKINGQQSSNYTEQIMQLQLTRKALFLVLA